LILVLEINNIFIQKCERLQKKFGQKSKMAKIILFGGWKKMPIEINSIFNF
jgi:hypothetical protein